MYIARMRITWTNYLEMADEADRKEQSGDIEAAKVFDRYLNDVPETLRKMFPEASIAARIEDDFFDFEDWDEEVGVQEAVVWEIAPVNLRWHDASEKILGVSKAYPALKLRVDLFGNEESIERVYLSKGKVRSPGGAKQN